MKKLMKFIRHYKGLMTGILLSASLCLWSFGCESKILSPRTGQMVTRVELQLEVDTFVKEIELKIANLDKQDAIKQKLFSLGVIVAETGVSTINPIGAVMTIASILGVGLAVDNNKKDALIKTLKRKGSTNG